MNEWMLRLKTLFNRRKLERDLVDELQFHLAMKQERAGATAGDARREFGNPTGIRDRCRDLWTFASLEAWWRDIRHALRTLRRSPAFTAVAVLSLAIGIGGNTAIFTLAHAMLLKSIPVADPDRLRLLTWVGGEDVPANSTSGYGNYDPKTRMQTSGSFSYPAYLEMRAKLESLGEVFAFRWTQVAAAADGLSEFVPAQMVSGNYFPALGVSPVIGRTIQPEDDRPSAPAAAVISHRLWERRFARSTQVLGSRLSLNGEVFTIIGVLTEEQTGMQPGEVVDVYFPIARQPGNGSPYRLTDNGDWWVQMFARLRPGVSSAQFQAAGDVVFRQMAMANAQPGVKVDIPRLVIEPGGQGIRYMRGAYGKALGALFAVVALVLLIACANLAGLLLARASARSREMAVRLSIGAGRFQIVRQLLTETTMLALGGGALGVLIAAPLSRRMVTVVPIRGFTVDITLNSVTLLFTAAVSIASGILFGLVPAFRATRLDLSPLLKEGSWQGGGPRLSGGRLLVTGQVALSVLLLVGASLAIRTFANLQRTDLGFDPSRMLVFRLDPSRNGYKGARLAQVYADVRERIAAIPGVTSVVISHVALISSGGDRTTIQIPGYIAPPREPARTSIMVGSDGYLTAMGIPLLLGRDLSARDTASAQPVAVVNETFAKKYFGGANPTGKTFEMNQRSIQIVGVCRDAKYESIRAVIPPISYLSYLQTASPRGSMIFNVRTEGPPMSVAPLVRSAVSAIDPQLPIADLRTEQDQIDQTIGPERFFAGFASAFGLTAALLAALGLYGVLAYGVARRTPEIGIRVALGAERGDVLWLVLRESLLVVVAGLAIGLPTALAMTRLAGAAVYGVQPVDPLSFTAGTFAMVTIASVAAWLPARRAGRIDPLVTLRHE
jgi:predicted permease